MQVQYDPNFNYIAFLKRICKAIGLTVKLLHIRNKKGRRGLASYWDDWLLHSRYCIRISKSGKLLEGRCMAYDYAETVRKFYNLVYSRESYNKAAFRLINELIDGYKFIGPSIMIRIPKTANMYELAVLCDTIGVRN